MKRDFIPIAGDKWYLNRQNDADGAFVRALGRQQTGATDENAHAPQGLYVATAGGALLAYDHFHPDPQRFLALLKRAEQKRTQATGEPVIDVPASGGTDDRLARRPPPDGLVLNVYSRIPLPPPAGKTWTPNMATGRDHLWLTKDEARALLPPTWKNGAQYPVPKAVAERLLRFHLVDNVRGEPDFWRRSDVEASDLTLRVKNAAAGEVVLTGTARMRSGDGRSYDARLQGYLTADRATSRVTRFDVVSWGDARGEGTYTKGAPAGRFPLVIALSLAGGKSGADLVPPQASREPGDYFGTGRAAR
jgi:hypothetical protein